MYELINLTLFSSFQRGRMKVEVVQGHEGNNKKVQEKKYRKGQLV